MPKISIIIPVHNAEKYLFSCLNSVLNQMEQNIEVIAIHDHSVDNSFSILKHFEKQYPYKLKVIDMKDSYGVSAARNVGLKLAQGEYIGFVDADDVVSLNMFGDFYKIAKKYSTPIVIGNCFRIRSDEMIKDYQFFGLENKTPKLITYSKNPIRYFDETPAVWDKLFSHEFLSDTKFLEGYVFEDIAFTYPLLLKANNVVNISRDDYAYRMTPNSIMTKGLNPDIHLLDIIEIVNESLRIANRFQLEIEKIQLLQDKLKLTMLRKLAQINTWNISSKEKEYLVNKIYSIMKYYFPDLDKLNSFHAKFLSFDMIPSTYHKIESSKEIDFEIESVKKRIKLLNNRN